MYIHVYAKYYIYNYRAVCTLPYSSLPLTLYLVVSSIDLALRRDVQLLPEYKGALHHVLHALVAPEIPAQNKGFIQSYI